MGHEIAHAVAKHSVERASRSVLLNTGTQLLIYCKWWQTYLKLIELQDMNTVGLLSQIGLMNPFNRKQESEADYLRYDFFFIIRI